MATWSPTTPIAVDMPGTAEWANMVQDNPVAIAEGASGAPSVRPMAMGTISAGGVVRVLYADEISQSSMSFPIIQPGSLRLSFEHRGSAGGVFPVTVTRSRPAYGAATIATWTNTTAYVSRTIDITVRPGDTIILSNDPPSGYTGGLRNITLSTSGEYIWPNGFDIVW